jgi:hypothetical protein
MARKQLVVVVVLGAFSLIMILVLVGVIFFSLSQLQQAAQPEPLPTYTPSITPIPTWTPTPIPTATFPPTEAPTSPPTVTPTPPFVSLQDVGALNQIELEVAALRGLEPLRPVPRWAITRQELRTYYVEPVLDEHWEEQLDALTLTLVAFDLMEPGLDLAPLLKYFFPESIAGFYDPQTGGIYIVSDTGEIGAYEQIVFAHEYGHALQDQHFDLLALGFDEFGFTFDHLDRFNAIRALVEGDAELIESQYLGALPRVDEVAYAPLARTFGLGQAAFKPRALDPSMQQPPIEDVFLFPYSYGEVFVQTLYGRGGWESVNEAYTDLPQSTEQILHPARYLSGDDPVTVAVAPLADTLGGDWRLVFEDPIGEFMLRVYLQNQLTTEEAAQAAEGWGGDLGVVYYDDTTGKLLMVLHSVWDTQYEAGEFLGAYVTYAARRYGHPASEATGGLSCWYGDDTLCVNWEGDKVTVVLGPDRQTVDRVIPVVSE